MTPCRWWFDGELLGRSFFETGLGWGLYRHRTSLERRFAHAGGSGPLPNWAADSDG